MYSNNSLSSRTLRDHVVLCYILTRLTRLQAGAASTFSPMQLVREARIDGRTVERHLMDITNTSINTEVRVGISNKIAPFVRGILIATSGDRIGPVGSAQLASFDLRTGIAVFLVTTAMEFSSGEPNSAYTPADVFRHVARMVFNAEEIPPEFGPAKIATATVSCKAYKK